VERGNNLFQFFLNGNNGYPFKNRQSTLPNFKEALFFVTDFMARHEEARIIEPAVNVRFDNLIHVAANTADQPDV
jgi:hypothetical protein